MIALKHFYIGFTSVTLADSRRPHNTVNSLAQLFQYQSHSSTMQATLPAFWCSLLLQVFDSGGNVHKPIWVIVLLALGMTMVGCSSGNGSNSTNVNGTWSASLTDSQNAPTYAFTTTLTEVSGGSVSISNFTFTSTGSCFVDGQTTETGSFTLSGDFSGNVKGTFGMTIVSTTSGGPQLTLQGGVGSNNTITGTWSLSGSTACSGSGNFTFTKV